MPTIELMTRKGCHLCADAKAALLRLQQQHPFQLIETDVDTDEGLRTRYGLEVPVVLLEGRKVAQFRVDESALLRSLRGEGT